MFTWVKIHYKEDGVILIQFFVLRAEENFIVIHEASELFLISPADTPKENAMKDRQLHAAFS